MRRALIVGAVTVSTLALGAAAVLAGGPVRRARSSRARSQSGPRLSSPRMTKVNCPSPSLGGTLPTLVYLPAGYDSRRTARFPVVYFLHGLPATPSTYTSNGFVASAVATGSRVAIVAEPQGARSAGEDREYLDWAPNENWPQAIAHDLTNCIDARFRSVAARRGRALVGLSAGGYGAFDIGLRNLATYGAVESWSGYFTATDPSGLHELNLGSPQANAMAQVPRGTPLKQALDSDPTYVAFYVGRQDSRFFQMNIDFDADLTEAKIPHLFRVYPGGHQGSLWRTEARSWLGDALGAIARER